jgi:D-glycero-D-manno-heptose 1,7-bisphosphate phosphatase
MEPRPAAFFDRDGVLNVDHGYVCQWANWTWTPTAIDAIKWLNGHGYAVIVVTNQSGIARGFYTEQQMHDLHAQMLADAAGHGGRIDAVYFCPHGPEADCDCRKPAPGMILRAMREHNITRDGSFLVGDREKDILSAKAAGIPGYWFDGSDLLALVQDVAAT